MTDGKRQEGERQQQPLTTQKAPKSTDEGKLPYPALAPVVFYCMKQTTLPRKWCLSVISNPYPFSLLEIYTCLTPSKIKYALDSFFFAFFLMEMVIKAAALGFHGHQGSYLSNNWNKFDFLIISGEILDHILASLGVVSGLHFFETLRPLRLIGRVPSMRILVMVIVDTLPMLANVLVLYIFFIHIFGVVGVQMWKGKLRNRCFLGEDIPTEYNMSLSPYYETKRGKKSPFICSTNVKKGMLHCSDVPPYTKDGVTCSLDPRHQDSAGKKIVPDVVGASSNSCINWNLYYNVCRDANENPHEGVINFDNIGYAWITIFQVVTLEGWTEIMYYVMDANSFWSFTVLTLVTIMGSLVMMNVCAVVIATQFSETMERETDEPRSGLFIKQLLEKFIDFIIGKLGRLFNNKVNPNDSGSSKYSLYRGTMTQIWKPTKERLRRVVMSKLFDRAIMVAVLLSVLTIAIEHHKQPAVLTHVLQYINITFTVIFVIEMVLKLLVLKLAYFKDKNNIFDFVIVMISLWEIIAKADGRLSALRAFRLLRFVRLVHFLPYLKAQLLVMKRTVEKAAALCMLLLFATFVFSVLGMHLFGCKFSFKSVHGDIVTDRKNFDSILWSMVTVFQILTQEDWNFVLYNAMASTSPWSALYFVALIMFGKHVLLNVLVGIVVKSYQAKNTLDESDSSLLLYESSSSSENPSNPRVNVAEWRERCNFPWIQKVRRWCEAREEWSFYMLSPQNRFRICCQHVVSHKLFDHMILLFILLSCVTIALERPGIDPKSTEQWILNMSRYVFSAVFFVEMVFKVLALGVVFGEECYCKSSWNIMDGSLVILSLVHIFVSLLKMDKGNMLGMVKVLRLLRALRPLRVIKRAPRLKLAIEALLASVKPIGNIVLICGAFFLFFGILGVQLFKGKFYYCDGYDTRAITNRTDCLSANYRWEKKTYNFDSLPQALMSLFVMYSKDGWVNIMYDGLDAVGVDKQPVRNYNKWMLIFFISFMIVSIFLLDMFIGVMVETFHECMQDQKQNDALQINEEQVIEEQTNKSAEPESVPVPYYEHYSPLRRSIHTVCTSSFLDLFMTVIIILSVLIMAFEHYNQPEHVVKLMEYSYYVFTAILIIEVLLKLVAFGALRFFQNSWNLLDLGIVVVSIISIIFTEMKMADAIPINPSILRVCRVLRLAQVLKAKKIRLLLKTVIKTLSQVGNLCLLFTFFFFIYAALGVELFGKLECTDDYPCRGLDRHANFKNFGMALQTLYKVCTGDNWSAIMKDTLRECRPTHNCVSYLSVVSPVYFTSFVIMAQFVLVNLVVAAIMQALEESNEVKELQPFRRRKHINIQQLHCHALFYSLEEEEQDTTPLPSSVGENAGSNPVSSSGSS
ncbi:voltage-dependent T-type calcium channel subunit alpha-1H-like [Scomber japonicus]|uniref:voltage-dependent T-type calcium channel subunit alpha-1H-like n=1 Tax=Scomber japonicus TaxID=13676 RepID=UPI0023050029|nr:voltage-dependent T-type calcium channel subunit alpha-1H-like [Scomber japonicus]